MGVNKCVTCDRCGMQALEISFVVFFTIFVYEGIPHSEAYGNVEPLVWCKQCADEVGLENRRVPKFIGTK